MRQTASSVQETAQLHREQKADAAAVASHEDWQEFSGEGSTFDNASAFYRGWKMRPVTADEEPGIRNRFTYQAPNGQKFTAADAKALDGHLSRLCKKLPKFCQVDVIARLASGYEGTLRQQCRAGAQIDLTGVLVYI
jgi:hypothetical protein